MRMKKERRAMKRMEKRTYGKKRTRHITLSFISLHPGQ